MEYEEVYFKTEETIQEEIKELKLILNKNKDSLTEEMLFEGMTGICIYEFNNHKTNPIIDSKIYFCQDEKIRYKVLDVEQYKCFVPSSIIENEHTILSLEDLLMAIDLLDVKRYIF